MEPIRTLLDRQSSGEAHLPESLRDLYGGDLVFPAPAERPYIIANFVSTLDGVVSYQLPGRTGGAEISGRNEGDRFIMGLLRATADAVLTGAETLHEVGPKHVWTAEDIRPQFAELYRQCRRGKSENPLNVFVSGSGRIDVRRAVFHTLGLTSIVITTPEGKQEVERACAAANCSIEIRAIEGDRWIAPQRIVDLLHREFGVRLLLHEGGPATLGRFLERRLLDELFLTVAPQIAGRGGENERLSLVRTVAFLPEQAPWFQLVSLKSSLDYLYLRYSANRS